MLTSDNGDAASSQFVHIYEKREPTISDAQETHHEDLLLIHEVPSEEEVSTEDFVGLHQHGSCAKYHCRGHYASEVWHRMKGDLHDDKMALECEIYDAKERLISLFARMNESVYTQLPTDKELSQVTDIFDTWVDRVLLYSQVVRSIYSA
jgi:hypothetical protein